MEPGGCGTDAGVERCQDRDELRRGPAARAAREPSRSRRLASPERDRPRNGRLVPAVNLRQVRSPVRTSRRSGDGPVVEVTDEPHVDECHVEAAASRSQASCSALRRFRIAFTSRPRRPDQARRRVSHSPFRTCSSMRTDKRNNRPVIVHGRAANDSREVAQVVSYTESATSLCSARAAVPKDSDANHEDDPRQHDPERPQPTRRLGFDWYHQDVDGGSAGASVRIDRLQAHRSRTWGSFEPSRVEPVPSSLSPMSHRKCFPVSN